MAVISQNEIHVKYVLDSTQLQNATQAMSGLTAQERQMLNDLKKLQSQLNATGQSGTNAFNSITNSTGVLGQAVQALIPVMSVAFAVEKLKEFAKYAFKTAMEFEQMGKTMSFVAGSTEKAVAQFRYMTALSKTFGLDVQSMMDGMKGFAASAAFAGVEQENINRQMLAFTKAAAALSMSGEDTKLMFKALAQMYSKSKIQAEELRGQLGERLPGAMELLAKSMKIDTKDLDAMLRKGEIITKEVMPAFAKEVELAFGMSATKTDTFTASMNRLITALETMVVAIMNSGIGAAIKWTFDRLAAIFDFIKWNQQDAFENQQDYFAARKVEVEKNVLFEIEQYRKAAEEKTGQQMTAAEAAKAILEDEKVGLAAHYKYISDENIRVYKESIDLFAKMGRFIVKLWGTIYTTIQSPLEVGKALGKDFLNGITFGLVGQSGNTKSVIAGYWDNETKAINAEFESGINLAMTRIGQLQYFAEDGRKKKEAADADANDKAAREAKNRYQKELQNAELRERIEKLRAEARIEDEHKRSQELIRISIKYNQEKAGIDAKYHEISKANESQGMKDLRQLTSENNRLRVAENEKFRSDIRRSDDKYYKEGYDAAVKALEKIQDWREKQAEKTADIEEKEKRRKLQIGKSKLQAELENDRLSGEIAIQNSNDMFDKKIAEAEAQKALEIKNQKLTNAAKKEIDTKWNDEILKLIDEKLRAKAALMLYWGNKEVENQAAIDRKLYQERARAIKEYVDRDNYRLQTNQLRERNALRDKKGNYREEEELDIKHQLELVDQTIKGNEAKIKVNEDYLATQKDLTDEEITTITNENNALTDEIERAYEERNQIALDSRDKRIAYETEVFKQSMVLMQTLVNGMFELQQAAYQQQLDELNNQAEEQIRLADGNKQKIDAINQERRMKEREIKRKQFKAEQAAAVAQVIFNTAPIIAQYLAKPPTIPLGILAGIIAAAQIGFILAKPVPEYEKGTKGKRHKGGPAIVGEAGVEKVVTESGKVYYTPPTATLLDLPRGAQVIPNDQLSRQDIYYASSLSGRNNKLQESGNIERKLDEIGKILNGLPIHQISMDERGFEKYIRTEKRTTKILNNRFGQIK